MLGGVGNVGTLGAKRRVISAGAGGGGGGGGQFLKSQGLTGAQGFTLNTLTASKDMRSVSSSRPPVSGFNPKSPAGQLQPSGDRFHWQDWGDDFFDDWGEWYIFNPADQTASYVQFSTINGADETFYTETQTHHSKTFKIVHGWAAQGIYKVDVACTSDDTFQFAIGHYGNMGSDSNTNNSDLTHTASWGTLHYNFNNQLGVREFFYTHVIPKKKTDNDSIVVDTTGLFTAVFSNDRLAIWTGAFTHGFTFYYIKGANNSTGSMANWVANDIAISNTYHD